MAIITQHTSDELLELIGLYNAMQKATGEKRNKGRKELLNKLQINPLTVKNPGFSPTRRKNNLFELEEEIKKKLNTLLIAWAQSRNLIEVGQKISTTRGEFEIKNIGKCTVWIRRADWPKAYIHIMDGFWEQLLTKPV
jgi:hypothetical protein